MQNWMQISDAEARSIAEKALNDLKEQLPGALPEGVVMGEFTADDLYGLITSDRWFWNEQKESESYYLPIDQLVKFMPGTRNVVTGQIDIFNIADTVKKVSIGDSIHFKGGGMSGVSGRTTLSKIEANGTDLVYITTHLGASSDVRGIICKY